MDYRLLGRSGLKVSALSIGTATFGGDGLWGATDVSDAQRQVDLCLDHGVNLIDTANVYGGSKSETIIGEARLQLIESLQGLCHEHDRHRRLNTRHADVDGCRVRRRRACPTRADELRPLEE